jgi:hypothetical protein
MRGTRHEYDTPSRESVEALVKAFLDRPHQESVKGGFAWADNEDLEELDHLLEALIKFRFAPDPDGDRPIRWSLCNWNTEQPHHFRCLPLDHKHPYAMDTAIANLTAAVRDLEVLRQHQRIQETT